MKKRLRDILFLLEHAREYCPRVIAYTLVAAILGVLLSLAELVAAPMILRCAEEQRDTSTLLLTVLVVTLVVTVLRFASQYIEGLFSESRDDFRKSGNIRLAKKALTMSYPDAVDPASAAKLHRAASAMSDQSDAPAARVWLTLSHMLINIIGMVFYAIVLSGVDVRLVIVTTLTTVLSYIVFRQISEWGYHRQEEEQGYTDYLTRFGRSAESASLAKDIRVFGMIPWLKDIHHAGLRALEAFVNRRAKRYIWTNIAELILTFFRNGLAYLWLIQLVLSEELSVSSFVLCFAAVGGFTMWNRGLLFDISSLRRELSQTAHYRCFLEQPDRFVTNGGSLPQSGCSHTLELRGVTFSYPGGDSPIFKNLNFTLHSGERVAIVGAGGTGKSTLVRLLCGLYDPDEGAVLLDGVDIRTLDRRAYYQLFSTVFQDNSLPEVTVAQTVAWQYDRIDADRVRECLAMAGLSETVAQLPRGIDTHIGRLAVEDGVMLSGGQMQRLLLARALYKNGDFLILDEPTAALDALAESELYQQYHRMTESKSAVFISHRLSSTRFCDRILYLKDGAIAEEGTHAQLMAAGGEYAALYRVQSRYYRQEEVAL